MQLAVGDRVAYTAAWLQSSQAGYDVAQLRGQVIGITPIGRIAYVRVNWGDAFGEVLVHPGNLCRVRSDGLILDSST